MKLLGDSEIEKIVRRLDRLTQDETRMTEVHIFEVVHGLMNNMKVMMEGVSIQFVQSLWLNCSVYRWRGIDQCDSKNSEYTQLLRANRIPRSLTNASHDARRGK